MNSIDEIDFPVSGLHGKVALSKSLLNLPVSPEEVEVEAMLLLEVEAPWACRS